MLQCVIVGVGLRQHGDSVPTGAEEMLGKAWAIGKELENRSFFH